MVRTPIASNGGWAIAALLDDTAMSLLLVLLVPVAILLVGAPVVLLVRLVIEIAQRF